MTTLSRKAETFGALHVRGNPVVIFNIWDAGSAVAVANAGAKVIGTGSWPVAAAQGYVDGQELPLDLREQFVARTTASVALPVTVDFEGAYAEAPEQAAANVMRLVALGVVGINFEDQVVDAGNALY